MIIIGKKRFRGGEHFPFRSPDGRSLRKKFVKRKDCSAAWTLMTTAGRRGAI